MKTLGYIGLGKMGGNMVFRLLEHGWNIAAYDSVTENVREVEKKGAKGAGSLEDLVEKAGTPRLLWLMVPHQRVDNVLTALTPLLNKGDTIIDGGNSNYKESIRRSRELNEKGINFLDVGVSGGPRGAREGACVMVGGEKGLFEKHEVLFKDIAAQDAYGYMGKSGAGHFVKMVHNGIEYGMMQAIAEGFAVIKASDFDIDLREVCRVYNHRSVIESRLTGWLQKAFEEYGEDLDEISGSVSHSGEGLWTVETAKELGVSVPVIEESLKFREESQKTPSYTGQILSALRNQFGGHEVKKKQN
ncbi:MAG: decarboxylating 6-phosphogluconate dehydrogenase [Nitrospirota bacterium]|nr:decarboxylating 6-phosphogluconate dehydrogenase [Nitrospirota bacterium]